MRELNAMPLQNISRPRLQLKFEVPFTNDLNIFRTRHSHLWSGILTHFSPKRKVRVFFKTTSPFVGHCHNSEEHFMISEEFSVRNKLNLKSHTKSKKVKMKE